MSNRQKNMVWRTFLLALAYVGTSVLALQLEIPPVFATPIFPAAGIAIVAAIIWGRHAFPGIAAGAFIFNVILSLQRGNHGGWLAISMLAGITMLGVVLQAWIGSTLLKRRVKPGIESSTDAMRFLLLVPLICLVSAGISALGRYWLLGMHGADLLMSGLMWWMGDSFGVLLGAPLMWIFMGRPRQLWWRRRWLLGLPLCLACTLFTVVYIKTSEWEAQRQSEQFRFKSQQFGDMVQVQFGEHERFLASMANVINDPTPILTADNFHNMAQVYLHSRPELRSMGWAPRVTDNERGAFEQWAKTALDHDFAIRQIGSGNVLDPALAMPEHYPITYIEPIKGNERARGLDLLSQPLRAATVLRTVGTYRPAASEPLMLVQETAANRRSVLLLQAVKPAAHLKRQEPIGITGLVLEMDTLLERTLASTGFTGFLARMEDITVTGQPVVVADALRRPLRAGDYQRLLHLGGREYRLTLGANAGYARHNYSWESWLVLFFGLLMTGMLSTLLLSISGERAQIQALVRENTHSLREREARLQAILDYAADAILTVAPSGRLVSVNASACGLFGFDVVQMQQLTLDRLLPVEAGDSAGELLLRLAMNSEPGVEASGRHSDGHLFPVSVAVSLVELPDEVFYVCVLHDLTEQRRSQEQIYELAHHDPLTGLANRFTLNLRLEQLLGLSRRTQSRLAVMFIDLDHFKKINDSHGHQTGDMLLVAVAQRLKDLLRDADTIARQGGDEFIVVIGNDITPEAASMIAKRILTSLSAPYQLEHLNLHTGASIGISMYPNDSNDITTLLLHADTAMYAAKSQGRGNFQFFSKSMNDATQERLLMENRLWLALDQQEFELYLQPQLNLSSGRIIGAEALIRWHHPELGMVPPDRFIPVAEESGLILPLGEWVLQRAVEILADWAARGLPPLRLAVNLSARQCHVDDLLPCIDRLLDSSGISTDALEMEITESAAMQDPERTGELLRELRARGIKVAIDDFGTGYSSLSYLKLFAIDRIKIDRSFVKDIETDQNDAVIVSATIALAHSLGLEVIAEGVETPVQASFLRMETCDEAQGYLFGKPMPLAEFETLVFQHNHSLPVSEQGEDHVVDE